MQFRFASPLYCATALTWSVAVAQQPAASPHPADSNAAVPALIYQSAFTDYTSYPDAKLAPWRDVNDEVARPSGHTGIFRGSRDVGHPPVKPRTADK